VSKLSLETVFLDNRGKYSEPGTARGWGLSVPVIKAGIPVEGALWGNYDRFLGEASKMKTGPESPVL
jgi:hypothetical protein